MDVLFVGAGPAGSGRRDRAGAAGRSGRLERARSRSACSRRPAAWASTTCRARSSIRAFSASCSRMCRSTIPFRERVKGEAVYLLTEGKRASASRRRRRCATTATTSASICEIVRWLGEKAEAARRQRLYGISGGFAAGRRQRCIGVRTAPSGLDRDGRRAPNTQAPTDITAQGHGARRGDARAGCPGVHRVAEGRLGEPADLRARRQGDLGGQAAAGAVMHTLGWPLPTDAFGGSFIYPQGPNRGRARAGGRAGLPRRRISTCTSCCSG